MKNKILYLFISLILLSCSNNKEVIYEPTSRIDPYEVYNEAYKAF